MDSEYSIEELISLVQEKINVGENLLAKLAKVENIDGVKKVSKKISQELKFLNKVKSTKTVKLNHVLCSNLVHFECLVSCLLDCDGVRHVDYPLPIEERSSPLRIDIICDSGATWIKVIARNPRSLSDAVHGRTGYGAKNILDQAEEYIEAADTNPYMYKSPKVIFKFASKIDDELIEEFESIGIVVSIPESEEIVHAKTNEINKLNLDITTLIAYVSSMTNGSCHWEFNEPLLTEQAKWEREKPIKPILNNFFEGKHLICCQTAVDSFNEILSFLGGPNEKERAEEFLRRVEILPDVNYTPNELSGIKVSGKIKPRSFQIFSFGVANEAITVTSNEGFVRAAKMQGLDVPVFIHDARALTEEKEKTAAKLESLS